MSEENVRNSCDDFKNELTKLHNEKRNGRPNLQTEEVVCEVDQKLLLVVFLIFNVFNFSVRNRYT